MLIVHIALTPLAGAPIRIVEAINKHTDFKARLIDFDPYRYKQRTFPEDLIWEKDKEQCLQLISQADIIHFHHFMDIESENNPFNINFKKIAPKAKFIRHYHTNLKQFCKWNNINETSVLNDKYPKLIVPHCAERSILDACIVPNIIPIYDAILTPRTTNNSPLQIFYSASSGDSSMWQARWESKGVPEVCSKFENLSKKADFNFKLIQNTPYVECMKLKQESDIIIGDTTSGSYHLTDLEALSMGKPVFSYLDSRSQFVLQNLLQCDSLPFINTRLEEIDLPFIELVNNIQLRKEIGEFSRNWIEQYYDDKKLVCHFVNVYEKLLNNEPIVRQENLTYKNAKVFLYNDLYDLQWKSRKQAQQKQTPVLSKEEIKKIGKNIFSVTNSEEKTHKIVNIAGLKLKFKRKNINSVKSKDDGQLKIEFFVSGGFGDFLINANYIYNFCKYIEKDKNNIKVDVYGNHERLESFKAVFKKDCNYIDFCTTDDNKKDFDYDLSIRMCAHTYFDKYNLEKIKKYSPKLYDLVKSNIDFNKQYRTSWFFYTNVYQYMLAKGLKYIQLPDITEKIGIKKEFDFPLSYPKNEDEILEKFNLKNKKFVTLNRAVDKNRRSLESTKMWPLEHFSEFAKLFKDKYPDILLVQLGASADNSRSIKNIDIDLVGKTDLEDIKVLIKNSILHIDCEGGFAHLRNALKAKNPAIVVFGPTNPDLYGYDSNINIKNNSVCPICCDWIHQNWQKKCIKTNGAAPCTASVSAAEVFEKADKYLQSIGGNCFDK